MASTSELDALFNGIANDAEAAGAEAVEGAAPEVEGTQKRKHNPIHDVARQELIEDPSIGQIKSSRAMDLEVSGIYSTYILKNIKPDKSADPVNGKYPRVQTSYKVGYDVVNVSDQPIAYTKPNYVKDEATGNYVDQSYEAELQPGESVILDRMNMTKLISRPEFSMMLRNGRVKKSSKSEFKNLDDFLRSHYFTFNDDAGHTVNDDDINVCIDEEAPDGSRTVKPEYENVFGYVLNSSVREEKPGKAKAVKEKKTTLSTQEATAIAIQAVLAGKADVSVFNSPKVK